MAPPPVIIPRVAVPHVHVEPVVLPPPPPVVVPSLELWAVLKVVLLMVIPLALMTLTWMVTYALFKKGAAGSVLIFTVIVMFGSILGAAIAGYLIRARGSCRWVAMMGILLMCPYFFIFWRFW